MKNVALWTDLEGRHFSVNELKLPHLLPLIEGLDFPGQDPVILDVGGGSRSLIEHADFGPERRPAIGCIDIAPSDIMHMTASRVRHFRAELDDLTSGRDPETEGQLRGFLHRWGDPANPGADAMVFSDVLNYVDYKQVLRWFDGCLKVGGFAAILNGVGRGFFTAFSDMGVQSDIELLDYCDGDLGYQQVQAAHLPAPSEYGDVLLAAFQKIG